MEENYPNLREQAAAITVELEREELRFLETLERGEKLLADILAKSPQQISGTDAFTLYDTYGFPLELTQEVAEEQGITVDIAGFTTAMEQQRLRARDAHQSIDLTARGGLEKLSGTVDATRFLGYSDHQTAAAVQALLVAGESVETVKTGDVSVVLNETPFYAEGGGQIGDRGYLSGDNLLMRVTDVRKESDVFVHLGHIERGSLTVGDKVTAQIDRACRRRAQANHTATHLLQAALKKLVDASVAQAGSLVNFDRLRFDFSCPRALTPDEVAEVEAQVNTWIAEAHGADVSVMSLDDAKARGATAMFGEKYSDEVRVIDFPGVSMELCGGTHVGNTAEIGVFKIISETGISSGVRRIEAVAGPAVLDYLNQREVVVKELGDRFKAKPEEIVGRVTTLQDELKDTQKAMAALKGELAAVKSDQLVDEAQSVGGYAVLVSNLGELDAKSLQTAAERLQQKLGDGAAVVLAGLPEEGKVSLVAAFGPQVNKAGLQAGKFIGGIAKICGGGGGGRPNLAQAGGRDASKLPEALETALAQLREKLG